LSTENRGPPDDIMLKPGLQAVATSFGLSGRQFITKTLTERQSFRADFSDKLKSVVCTTVPGGLCGTPEGFGDDPYKPYMGCVPGTKLMIICSHPTAEAVSNTTLPVDELRRVVNWVLDCTSIRPDEIYVGYAVPFFPKDAKLETTYVTAFRPFLEAQVRAVNPENILVMGASSLKALFGAKGVVNSFYGKSGTYNDTPVYYTVDLHKLQTNPKSVLTLDADMLDITTALGGKRVWSSKIEGKDYRVAWSPEDLQDQVVQIFTAMAMNGGTLDLAVDLEWGNTDGKDGILHDIIRYAQMSWKPDQGLAVVLTDPELQPLGGQECRDAKLAMLKTVLECPGIKICGHNFKTDLLHLMQAGIDCRKTFTFDTMTAYHYLMPQVDKIGLEALSVRLTNLGRYDLALDNYIKGAGLTSHVKAYGYSRIPDEVLLDYSCCDVDAVIQAKPKLEAELQKCEIDPRYRGYEIDGVKCVTMLDSYYRIAKLADECIFEPEFHGLPVDLELMKSLQVLFSEKLEQIKAAVNALIPDWQDFNPDSTDLRVYLFGNQYGKKPKKGLEYVPKPSLELNPVQTTGKYAQPWDELSTEERLKATPATDGDSLSILIQNYPQHSEVLQTIVDYKAINQVLKNFLRPPEIREDEEDGDQEVYTSGWISRVDDDQRIRGTYLQTTETGRFRSFKPNLNNMSSGDAEFACRKMFATSEAMFDQPWKKMDTRELIEKDFLDPRYDIIRSVVRARPGYVILGSDFKTAEINVIAAISGDPELLKVVRDPSLDIHAETATRAFGIKIPEGEIVKSYIKARHDDLRTGAKSVLFG